MELQGKILCALPQRSGESKRNPGERWVSQDFVVETHDNYPKKMVFTVFGSDRLQRFNIQVGQEVTVSFDIDAREWNGRWFNDVRAFDVRQIDPAAAAQAGAMGAAPFPPQPEPFGAAPAQPAAPAAPFAPQAPAAAPFPPASGDSSENDLPF